MLDKLMVYTVIIVKSGIGKWFENVAECLIIRMGDNIQVRLLDPEHNIIFRGLLEKDEELRFDYTPLSKSK